MTRILRRSQNLYHEISLTSNSDSLPTTPCISPGPVARTLEGLKGVLAFRLKGDLWMWISGDMGG